MKECPYCGVMMPDKAICLMCEMEVEAQYAQIERLILAEGHTEHCAKRIVWGDGECECHVEGKGDGLPKDFPRFHKLMGYGE